MQEYEKTALREGERMNKPEAADIVHVDSASVIVKAISPLKPHGILGTGTLGKVPWVKGVNLWPRARLCFLLHLCFLVCSDVSKTLPPCLLLYGISFFFTAAMKLIIAHLSSFFKLFYHSREENLDGFI